MNLINARIDTGTDKQSETDKQWTQFWQNVSKAIKDKLEFYCAIETGNF